MLKFLKNLFGKKPLKYEEIFDNELVDKADLQDMADIMRKATEYLKKVEDKSLREDELLLFLRATWCQKQLDDLLLMNQSIMQQLKQSPFNAKYLEKRDKCHHDINTLQPIVLETGIAAGTMIEKRFGVEFCLLTGKNRPAPKKDVPEGENKTQAKSAIILPG